MLKLGEEKLKVVEDIHGSPKEGHKKFFSHLYMLEKVNPGTKTSLLLDAEKGSNTYLLLYELPLKGFSTCRRSLLWMQLLRRPWMVVF